MKSPGILVATAATLLALGSTHIFAGEPVYNSPNTAQARDASDLLQRGARAISAYVSACAQHKWQRLDETITPDAVFEYLQADPGTYLTLDAIAVDDYCKALDKGLHVTASRTFPTNDPNSMFVEYEAKPDESSTKVDEHLVLLTMRGGKIARIRDFTVSGKAVERVVSNGSGPTR
jgi:ketosteroid isomerase-like protein